MSHKNDENLMERMMKELVKTLLTLLVFFVIFILVLVPLLKEKFGVDILGFAARKDINSVTISESIVKNTYVDGVGFVAEFDSELTNKSDQPITNVALEFTLYDEEQNEIGSAVAEVENVDAKGVTKFTAVSRSPHAVEATSYKLKNILPIKQ